MHRQPWVEHGPHDLSGVALRDVAPPVAECADDAQPAAGLSEGPGRLRHRGCFARVGDRAEHARPWLEQAEPDRPTGPGVARPRQGVPQRVGQQLRCHDRDVLAAFCRAPPVQGGDGEVPGGTDRPRIRAERANGDPRQQGPAHGSRIRRWPPSAVHQAGRLRGQHQPTATDAVRRVRLVRYHRRPVNRAVKRGARTRWRCGRRERFPSGRPW
jgi:hypothetical protein